MKTITVLIPTYNEEKNIPLVYERTQKVFLNNLSNYECKILFVDNCSKDNSQKLIRDICEKDQSVSAIFNIKNFGFSRSQFNGLREAKGDAVVIMFADMQDPPEVIPSFVEKWEQGAKVVCGIKNKSKENPLMYFCRKFYYKIIKKISEIEHIEQYDGFGLYDRSFLDILKKINDDLPYFRGIVAEYGAKRADVLYKQDVRRAGKSSFNFFSLYDLAMLGITSYSRMLMHACTILGAIASLCCIGIAIWAFVEKLINWNTFSIGVAATQVGVFFIGAIQLFFIGLVGEYVAFINTREMKHPLVIEKERINF